jgi:mRNA interferase MazF
VRPDEVYWVEYPIADGHEQTGRRPSIVLQDDTFAIASPLVLVIPLTSSIGTMRFPGVVFVAADAQNGLSVDSYALVFQMRATDRRRLRTKLGDVSTATLGQLYQALDHLTGHP